ncbi:MAG: VOC family protein [Bacteroidota bacterium]
MKFAYTILYVEDVEKTMQFYGDAFGFQKKFSTPEGDYGELISGETTIAFASKTLAQSNLDAELLFSKSSKQPFGIELAFTTENIEEDYAKAIEAGAIELAPIVTKPWGQKVAYVQDINGFLIEICTPIAG